RRANLPRRELAQAAEVRRRRNVVARVPEDPRAEASRQLEDLPHQVDARGQSARPEEARRRRAAPGGRLRGDARARSQDSRAWQIPADGCVGEAGATLRDDGTEGAGRRVADEARNQQGGRQEGREAGAEVSVNNRKRPVGSLPPSKPLTVPAPPR